MAKGKPILIILLLLIKLIDYRLYLENTVNKDFKNIGSNIYAKSGG